MGFLSKLFGKGKSQMRVALENQWFVVGNGFAPQTSHVNKLLKEGYLGHERPTRMESQWSTEAEGRDKASYMVAMWASSQHGYPMEALLNMNWEIERVQFPSGEEFLVAHLSEVPERKADSAISDKDESRVRVALENHWFVAGNGFVPQTSHVNKLLKEGYLKGSMILVKMKSKWRTEPEGKDKVSYAAAKWASSQHGYPMEALLNMDWELERVQFPSGEEFLVAHLSEIPERKADSAI